MCVPMCFAVVGAGAPGAMMGNPMMAMLFQQQQLAFAMQQQRLIAAQQTMAADASGAPGQASGQLVQQQHGRPPLPQSSYTPALPMGMNSPFSMGWAQGMIPGLMAPSSLMPPATEGGASAAANDAGQGSSTGQGSRGDSAAP